MHADAHFVPGSGHAICEDFAWAERTSSGAFAVLCDGCTSAPHTDVGSRILALATARSLRQERAPEIDAVLRRATLLSAAMGLSTVSLCATMLWARVQERAIIAQMRGDGVVAARRRSGELEVWWVEFPCGAPDYPIYRLDLAADHPYRNGGDGWRMHHVVGDHVGPTIDGRGPIQWSLRTAEYDRLVLLSDGATAFCSGRAPVSVTAAVQRMCAFRSVQGRFAARRLNRVVTREAASLGWTPHDDLSVAALAWEDAA